MMRSTRSLLLRPAALGTVILALAACAGGDATADTATPGGTAGDAAAAAGGEQTPDPGRTVIEVEMVTDDQGNNVFRPADFEAKPGDVVRFTLVSGVHNVHFPADSNAGATNLPGASDMFQLPGQTYDLKVTQAHGRHFFQCDPHALLGMVGHMTVAP